MALTRRDLLKAGASAAALGTLATLPRPLLAQLGGAPEPVPPIRDPRIKQLALRAIDAARAAGAAYADVRLTHTRIRGFDAGTLPPGDSESIVVGVRALVDGYWGFASSPIWSPDEMARLGQEAVHQAKTNAIGQTRRVVLEPIPVVVDQHWTMPVETDPFEISPFAITDHLLGLNIFVSQFDGCQVKKNIAEFQVQEKAFASTEGSYWTQRTYRSSGRLVIAFQRPRVGEGGGALDSLTPAGLGWELYTGQPLREQLRRLIDQIDADLRLPLSPVEVGRYDTVCDAMSLAALLDGTLGRATELDRALGYEANAGGTSFLTDPAGMVGTLQVGAPTLTVTANRAAPGGAATVKWDDEGVTPGDVTLVKDGVLTDFQTTRESAPWLAEHYARRGGPAHSHGCAAAPSALEAPLTHTPNLVLAPGSAAGDFEGLIKRMGKGLAVREMGLDMDFQAAGGMGAGQTFEVKDGKRVARIAGAGILFRSTELWKALKVVGGPESARRYGFGVTKGEPTQTTYHSVTAPPAAFQQLTVVDPMRKA